MNELTNCEIDFVRGDGELVVSRVGWGLDLTPSLLFSPALERPAPVGFSKALGCLHAKGLVHRDIKPAGCAGASFSFTLPSYQSQRGPDV